MRPPLLELFAAYRDGRTDFPLAALDPPRLLWAIESGLGPLLARCCADDARSTASSEWELMRGADLAARVTAEDQAEATAELIDACAPRVGRLTLLKGIWLGQALYPEPHLRPMRDVDVLVAPEAVAEVEEVLSGLGYEAQPNRELGDYREHHHTFPYRHSGTGVFVEVHRRLFRSERGASGPFGADRVRAQSVPATFRGRQVLRLSDELQLAYVAAHWAASLKTIGGPGGLLVLLDVLGLVGHVDWDEVLRGLERTAAAGALLLLLTYLETRGLLSLAPDARDRLWRCQRTFGQANLALLHLLMDRRLADGRAYGQLAWSRRNFEIVWTTLLRPRSAVANLLALPWQLVPARWRGAADGA